MGGPNLEVFKVSRRSRIAEKYRRLTMLQFGMYIMFPIGIMYYFGANLENRFAVPDFWPEKGQTHTIPFEKEDIAEELQNLKARRLAARARRLRMEQIGVDPHTTQHQDQEMAQPRPDILQATHVVEPEKSQVARTAGWSSWFK